MTKSQIKLVITITLGWLGVHKFMDKKPKMGFVYLLTGGLYGIGWLVDVVKALFVVLNEGKSTVSSKPAETKQATPQTVHTPPVIPESEKNYNLFDKVVDNFYLAYEYEEKIAFRQTSILTGNGGKKLKFKQEPDNEYDNHAVALYLDDDKVGYLYRGMIQDMVNNWIRRNDFFWGHINKVDVANNTATFKVGFYKDIRGLEMKSFKLTRITKKGSVYESSRFENIECCNDGDIVEYESSFETDNYIITNEYGNELGELGTKAVEWINENEDGIKFARINNIEETESGGYKANIEFFYR